MPVNTNAMDPTGLFDGYSSAEHYEPSHADKELAKNLKEWFTRAEQFQSPRSRTWRLNHSYLNGDQLLARHKVTGDIVRLSPEDSRRLRSQNNVLRPTARSLVGKLSRMIPTYTVDPATSDFEEQHGAKAGDLIMQYIRIQHDLDLKYTRLCSYLPWAGNAFAHLSWDRLGGRRIASCNVCHFFSPDEDLVNQPCPQCVLQKQEEAIIAQQHAQLQEQYQSDVAMAQSIGAQPPEPPPAPPAAGPLPPGATPPLLVEAREGDIRIDIRDPRDVFVQPGCTDLKEASRVCIRTPTEVARARAMFPDFALFIRSDDAVTQARPMQHSGTTSLDSTGTVEDWEDYCFVYEFHEAPTEAYTHGRLIYMVNDMIVDERESPYFKLGRAPVYHFGFDPVDGEFYRDAFITQAWHRQRELNLLETQLREHVEQVLRPKLMNPIGSRITADEFHAATDQVINYAKVAGEPEWIRPPDLPQGIWNRKSDLLQDIRMGAGITESEQGLSVSDPNGRAMAIINAEADQQIGPIMALNNAEWRDVYRGALILYQCYAHPDRKAAVAGPDGTTTAYFGQLNLLQPGWDLRMEQEEGLSRNPAVRMTQAMDLARIGFFMDPMTGMFDRKGFARYAKLRTPDAGYDLEATERAAAAQIPIMLQRGGQWQPRQFDVAQIFADELASWLRGPGRRADMMLSQQVEQIWMYYMQIAMAGAMAGAPVGGAAGGGEGGASQPGQDFSAPGGTMNNQGHLGTDLAGGAQAQVSAADQAGESAAGAATQ